MRLRHHVVFILLGIALATALTGCGEDVDPRFATPDALIDYYNELAMAEPTIDAEAIAELLYAETDLHRRLIDLSDNANAMNLLFHTVQEHFGEVLPGLSSPLAPNQSPATITKREDQRAEAIEVDSDGSEVTIYLVKADGRWWLSAYTIEYIPGIQRFIDRLDALERMVGYWAAIAPDFTERVTAGEFESFLDFNSAAGEAIVERFPELIDNPQWLFLGD